MKRTEQKKPPEINNKQSPYDIKKYLTLRNILLMIILLISYLMFPKIFQPVVLILVFYPISLLSCRVTKYVKFMTVETITPFTIFLGYIYGWQWAVFFGFFLGTYIWTQTAMNQLTFIECFTYIFAAFVGHWAAGWFPGNFVVGYLVAVTLRNIFTFVLFIFFNPSLVENITHTFQQLVMNTLFAPLVLSILYNIIMAITPH